MSPPFPDLSPAQSCFRIQRAETSHQQVASVVWAPLAAWWGLSARGVGGALRFSGHHRLCVLLCVLGGQQRRADGARLISGLQAPGRSSGRWAASTKHGAH